METGTTLLDRYLHPEYAMFDYRISNFDSMNLSDIVITKTPLDSKNKRSNQERYRRVAYESLEEFGKKDNRKTRFVVEDFEAMIKKIVSSIRLHRLESADSEVIDLIEKFSLRIIKEEWD